MLRCSSVRGRLGRGDIYHVGFGEVVSFDMTTTIFASLRPLPHARDSVDPNFIALPRGDMQKLEAASGLRLAVCTRYQGLCRYSREAEGRRGSVELCVPGWPCSVKRQGRSSW